MIRNLWFAAAVALAGFAVTAGGLPQSASAQCMGMGMGCMGAGTTMGSGYGMGYGTGMNYGMGAYVAPPSLPGYSMGNYASLMPSYATPNTYLPAGPGYSTAVTMPAPAYVDSGQYCTDATGGEVWVGSGAPTVGLTCGGAAASTTSPSSPSTPSGYSAPSGAAPAYYPAYP